jgi:octaprenyl-diphosphate synthase
VTLTSEAIDLRACIDAFFRETFSTSNALITEAVRRMLAAGGKRLRPRLTLLAAQAAGADVTPYLSLAAYMELIHVATLIHDDVVDQADLRRGVNATAIDFGNRISVLTGDYLFAWIFKNVTAEYSHPIPHILSATLAAICDGEVLQIRSLGNLSLTFADYREIVTKKTASLFAASARCGAIGAGADPAMLEAITTFGERFGVAFQMQDDLLDFMADRAELGKPVGHDLIERKVTMPVITALSILDERERAPIAAYYDGDAAMLEPAIRTIIGSGALSHGRALVERTLDEAVDALAPLPKESRSPFVQLTEALRG